MTQATPDPRSTPKSTPPHAPAAADELVARYQAAQAALDADASTAVQPSPAVRAHVMAYAQQLADARRADTPSVSTTTSASTSIDTINSVATQSVNTWTTGSFEYKKPANNDSQWKIKALASVAVFGLSSLLFVQWQNATPDEQDAAFSMQRPANVAAPAAAPAPAPAPAPVAATVPAPAVQSDSTAAAAALADTSTAVTPPQPANPIAKAPSAANAGVTTSKPLADTPVAVAETRVLDKESAKAQAAAPATESIAKSSSPAPMLELTAETATGNAPQMEPAPAPVSAAPATAALAPARPSAAPRDATLEQSQENMSAARGKPSASSAAKKTNSIATNPAGSSTADSLAAGPSSTAAPKPLPQSAPLVAAASVNSVLFKAIRSKNRNALQTALDNGADRNAKDNGTPAIIVCVQTGQTELVRLLAAADADVNALDAQGISALEHARGRGLQDIITLLVQYGAK